MAPGEQTARLQSVLNRVLVDDHPTSIAYSAKLEALRRAVDQDQVLDRSASFVSQRIEARGNH